MSPASRTGCAAVAWNGPATRPRCRKASAGTAASSARPAAARRPPPRIPGSKGCPTPWRSTSRAPSSTGGPARQAGRDAEVAMTWSTRCPRAATPSWVLGLGVALLLAGGAAAQQRSLTGSGGLAGDAYLQRQLRSLERRDGSVAGASLQLQRARRDLVRQSGGVAFTPEQARINRGLDRVGRELQRRNLDAVRGAAVGPAARRSAAEHDRRRPAAAELRRHGHARAPRQPGRGRAGERPPGSGAVRSGGGAQLGGQRGCDLARGQPRPGALQARMAAVEAQLRSGG